MFPSKESTKPALRKLKKITCMHISSALTHTPTNCRKLKKQGLTYLLAHGGWRAEQKLSYGGWRAEHKLSHGGWRAEQKLLHSGL